MDATLGFILIFVLAVVLVALGLGLSRRAKRADHVDRIPGERPPAGPVSPTPPYAPTATIPPVQAPSPEDAIAEAGTAEPEAEQRLEAPPPLRERLGKTRAAFARLRGKGRISDDTWDDVEDTLLLADVGMPTTERILADVRDRAKSERAGDGDELMSLLHSELVALLDEGDKTRTLLHVPDEPNVWMFVGVNGVGKTTTIAKVAQRETEIGHQVVLAAADTFRAAAAEQLTHWADVTGAGIVRGQEGADPGSVVYDAMSSAASRDADLVLVDTAGRLHTKTNLMAELEKLRRIVERTPGALKEVLLVLDATTGQNGLTQAKQFAEAVDVTGVVLTKLDGTAKGGIVLAIEAELGIPVKLIGVGESSGDLIAFEPEAFVAALLDA
ncbi:MAG TPA: signal recognition particle-docking protein FtsY [Acidimicrobiia bacterium]|jgi:fused signal recognition particle receptor|nr:signal recognition particle-docking protein FtsY [Acidimicrobiia bacterium]